MTMLAYRFRFHGHGSLKFVYKNGQAIRSHAVTIKYIANPRRNKPRFSVVVSKKVLKSAVGRNTIRRRIYEAIRESQFNSKKAIDVVVIVSSSEIQTMPWDELRKHLGDLLDQTGLYNAD